MLSASSWRWINDDPESLTKRLCSQYSQPMGTLLHEIAYKHIKYRMKMNKYDKKNVMLELLSKGIPGLIIDSVDFDAMFDNLMTYINDGIGFKMTHEVVLYYSDNFFGTADTILFSERERFLRIHDYKSGTTPAHMEQLLIYAALFCLEYQMKPSKFDTELRIYQSNEVIFHNPEADEIVSVMDKIVNHDKFLNSFKEA
jgi:hypothetical protein